MLIPKEIENMLMTAANKGDTSRVAVPETVQSTYQQDIDAHKLEVQLQIKSLRIYLDLQSQK